MQNYIVVAALIGAFALNVIGCTSKSSPANGQATIHDFGDLTVNSVPPQPARGATRALTGDWGLVDFSCASGHSVSAFAASLVQFKSTMLTFRNGVIRVYSKTGPCSFDNYQVVAVDGDQLVYNGGAMYSQKQCGRMSSHQQGVSNQAPDKFTIQGSTDDDQLLLRSPSTGVICPQGDTTIQAFTRLTDL